MFIINNNYTDSNKRIKSILSEEEFNNINEFIKSYKELIDINKSVNKYINNSYNLINKSVFSSLYPFNDNYKDSSIERIRSDLNSLAQIGINKSNRLVNKCDNLRNKLYKDGTIDLINNNSIYNYDDNDNIWNNYSNLVFSNEMGLINDYFEDYNEYCEERRDYFKDFNSYVGFDRDIKFLCDREESIDIQGIIFDNLSNLDEFEVDTAFSVIASSYNALLDSQNNDLSNTEFNSYSKKMRRMAIQMNICSIKYLLNDCIYITKKNIKNYRKQKVKKID